MRRASLALAIVFVGSGCLWGGCEERKNRPAARTLTEYMDAETEHRKARLQPLIEAVEKHRADRKTLPDTPDALVAAGYLAAPPDLSGAADHEGKPGRLVNCAWEYRPGPTAYRLVVQFEASAAVCAAYSHRNKPPRRALVYDSESKKWSDDASQWRAE